ncbi:hypothetical protein FGE12_08580 [Aggregicoccus sp. 17bor-14]|uniref:hypothetical protein n=1 Tax=Myxococcaceae TaxID=31 RepID=UPI00129C5900|nr:MULTISPECIES: hypothetical protein [Myxococcaceae]MBF5042454.1 hypothetical protein [Simulacricoccus sp. 17bor-14]MRI88225.1 hypothetical protein [Aggregicoccus sp. 17bor-14]
MKRIVLGILVSSMLLGACTAHEKSGDRAAAVGDWKSAYMSYRAALGDEPTPELQKKFAEARDHAMADTQKRAQACAQVNDWNCALQEADFALQIDGGNAELASFRANAANQVALSHLEAADAATARGQFPEAVASVQRALQLSSSPEVKARAEAVRQAFVQRGHERVEGYRREGNLQAAANLASLVAAQDGGSAAWANGIQQEYAQFTQAEYERLARDGDAARHAHDWRAAEDRYQAALAMHGGGRAEAALEYVRRVGQAEERVQNRDWAGAAQGFRQALTTGQDDGYARDQLERVEPRPYRVQVRSVLVSPVRPDGDAWVGTSSPLFLRLANRIVQQADKRGSMGLVEDLAMSLPAENRPNVRIETQLPEGALLTTGTQNGVLASYDAEMVLVTNGFDERRITFRVLADGPQGSQTIGTVDVPVKELAGRAEVTLQGRSILALRLGTAAADGRQPGSYVGMTPVQQGGGMAGGPQQPGNGGHGPQRPERPVSPPAHATMPTP